jgi:CubicO group peptidase (beta-lactamase class C family)
MRVKTVVWITLLFVVSNSAHASNADTTDELLNTMIENTIPSTAYAVIKDNKVVSVHHYSNPKHRSMGKLYNTASLAKPLFAVLVLNLVDKKLWSLDAPISEYWVDPTLDGLPYTNEVTTRHVLSHRTGFPNWRSGENLAFLFKPGAEMQYSGEGFEYLKRAVEHHFEMTIEELFKKYLGRPHSLNELYFTVSKEKHGEIFEWFSGEGQRYPMHAHDKASAADDLLATIEGYAEFVSFVMSGAGLSPELFNEMLRFQGQNIDSFKMGLSWEILELPDVDQPVFIHTGGDIGVNCIALFSKQLGEGIVIFTNSDNGKAVYPHLIRKHLSFGHKMF